MAATSRGGTVSTTIEHVYDRIRTLMEVDFPKTSSRPYKASADPFTFDSQPRSDLTAYYADPPLTTSAGLVGDVEAVQASITIWLSREAGEDAAGAAVSLAGDLARLRHAVVGLDFGNLPSDVNVHDNVATQVQPRAEGAVVVVGACRVTLDYLATSAHP